MSADLRMLWFHIRQFGRTGYFVQLLLTSTLSVLALQLLAASGSGADASPLTWLRAGMVGTWSVCTVAAGMIGFQRFQGTLVHLVMTPRSPVRTLLPLVGSAASFGLLAFPIAAAGAALAGHRPVVSSWPALVLGVIVFWLACLAISSVVAAVFVLTPDALTYEGLLAVPLVLLSGVFGLPTGTPGVLVALTHVLPTTPAVSVLTSADSFRSAVPDLLLGLGVTAVWLVIARGLVGGATRRALVDGTLEVV